MNAEPEKPVTHLFYAGLAGSSTAAINLIMRTRHEVPQRVVMFGTADVFEEYAAKLERGGVKWTYVRKTGRFDLKAYFQAAKELSRNSSMIILHGPQPPLHFAIRLSRVKCPVIVWLHSHCEELAGLSGLLAAASANMAYKTIFISHYTRNILATLPMGKSPASRGEVINNAVDADFWSPDENAIVPANPLKICFASTLTPRKRPELAIEVMLLLREKSVPAQLEICGDGPLLEQLKRRTKELALDDTITFSGGVSQAQLRDTFRRSHLLLHTSRAEGVSMSVLEALASGLPVVGMAEGLSGCDDTPAIMRCDSTDSLAEKIASLTGNREKYLSLRDAGRKFILAGHSLEKQAEMFVNFCSKFL